MKIIETVYDDLNEYENLTKSKAIIGEKVIENIEPIFNEEYKSLLDEVKVLQKEIKEKKEKIMLEKDRLKNLVHTINNKNKENVLLSKFKDLINTGLIKESMKSEMIKLLENFSTIPESKITSYLNETIIILSQKMAK